MMDRHEMVEWRKRVGMSQDNLAKALGYSRRQIIAMEAGEVPIRRVVALALERLSLDLSVSNDDPKMLIPRMKYMIIHSSVWWE